MDGAPSEAAGGLVTDRVQQFLRETRPWVKLMSVLTFIGAGLMVLAALAMLALGVAGGAISDSRVGGAMFGGGLAVIYLVMALLYTLPGLFLWRYAAAINRLGAEGSVGALEDALMQQRSFWRFVGILTLVAIGLAVIGVIAGIGLGLAMGSMMR